MKTEKIGVLGLLALVVVLGMVMSGFGNATNSADLTDYQTNIVYDLTYEPVKLHGDENYLYYTIATGGTYRVNRTTGIETLFCNKGHDLLWVEGDYVYVGEGYELGGSGTNELYKFNKITGELVWHVHPTSAGSWGGATFQFGVGKFYLYARAAAYGYGAISKDDGTVLWASSELTRYPDKVMADLKNDVLVETGLWSTNTIQRVSKVDGAKIWQRKGPTGEMGETTHPVDITDDAIWIRWYKGTYPNQYFYALAKWDRSTGEFIEGFPELPYYSIWHLGPEGSLIFDFPDEKDNALVWNKNLNRLEKVNTQTWEVYWTTDFGYPLEYVADRPFIDKQYIYLKNKTDPTKIAQYQWKVGKPPIVTLISPGTTPVNWILIAGIIGIIVVIIGVGVPVAVKKKRGKPKEEAPPPVIFKEARKPPEVPAIPPGVMKVRCAYCESVLEIPATMEKGAIITCPQCGKESRVP